MNGNTYFLMFKLTSFYKKKKKKKPSKENHTLKLGDLLILVCENMLYETINITGEENHTSFSCSLQDRHKILLFDK